MDKILNPVRDASFLSALIRNLFYAIPTGCFWIFSSVVVQ